MIQLYELKDILLGMLVLIYGIMFYIVGRTNLLEKFVLKLNKMLEDATKTDDTICASKEKREPKEKGGAE